jgi:hemoglobin-like flavoprotein
MEHAHASVWNSTRPGPVPHAQYEVNAMTPTQKLLVQLSLEKVLATTDRAAAAFYERLFELDPALRPLFRSDMREQERKFVHMLECLAEGLDDLEGVLPEMREMGQRHVAYGAREEHYAVVGAALLWSLEQAVGATFTPEVRDAWERFYELLSGEMKAGARQALPAAGTLDTLSASDAAPFS